VNEEALAQWGLLRQKQINKVVYNNEKCRNDSPETDDMKQQQQQQKCAALSMRRYG
jgi:hypothetical protein